MLGNNIMPEAYANIPSNVSRRWQGKDENSRRSRNILQRLRYVQTAVLQPSADCRVQGLHMPMCHSSAFAASIHRCWVSSRALFSRNSTGRMEPILHIRMTDDSCSIFQI